MLTAVVSVSIGTSIVWAADLSDGDSDVFDTRSELVGVFAWLFPFSGPFRRCRFFYRLVAAASAGCIF